MIKEEDWTPADGLILEPNALTAAKERARCLALTAGPGAGKTEMLAQRADFLLRTGSCRYPKRILAISFKVDAARNLKERVRNRCGQDMASRFDSYTFHAFAKRIIDRFRVLLTGKDALDPNYTIGGNRISRKQIAFGDLVPLAIQILQSSSIARNAIRQTYCDVFLDEFQDCTNLQYELLKVAFLGTATRLTAVGDTKQKIMGWAGAMDGIFATFAEDFNAIPLNMYRNFRSKPRLLRLQNEIIRNLDPNSVMPEEQLLGEEGEIYSWQFQTCREEANQLADATAYWIEQENRPPSEIAILISKQLELYAHQLMEALKIRGIPFRNEQQLQDISTEPAAQLVVDYLSCVYGQCEPKAWIRLLSQMIPFADDDTQNSVMRNINRFIKDQRKAVTLACLLGDPYSGWWESVIAFVKTIGIRTVAALSPEYESMQRLREVLRDTKARIGELLNSEKDLLKALSQFYDDESVRILTIHKSKGLEFDTVIMMAIENEIFFGNQDENRCAFFVGVSRAKRNLILSTATQRERPPNHTGRWDINRTAQQEYLSYANPFLRNQV